MRVWTDLDLCTGDGLCTDHCPRCHDARGRHVLHARGRDLVPDRSGPAPQHRARATHARIQRHRCGTRMSRRVHLHRGARDERSAALAGAFGSAIAMLLITAFAFRYRSLPSLGMTDHHEKWWFVAAIGIVAAALSSRDAAAAVHHSRVLDRSDT